ncbi:MAG: GntR family transcriptional regulator [Bacillota bacterium]|nr:GntR family transcriptional regulator [Bacillota bacterium]
MDAEFDDKLPIYIQIMNIIKRDIVMKKLKEGDKLPSVREMSASLKVNPNTMQRVYQELEREGITTTQRGIGTFVTCNEKMISNIKIEMAKEIIETFIGGMKNLGFEENEIIQIIEKNVKGGGDLHGSNS